MNKYRVSYTNGQNNDIFSLEVIAQTETEAKVEVQGHNKDWVIKNAILIQSTSVFYKLVTGFIYDTIPNSFAPENFDTPEAAEKYFNAEYKNRNKGDEYDKHWNNIPLCIQKKTIITDRMW